MVDADDIVAEAIQDTTCSGVYVQCTLKSQSADSCVVVSHNKTTSSEYGLLVQELSNQAGGCIESVSLNTHYLAVFGFNRETGIIGKRAVSIVGSGMLYIMK